MIQFTVLSYGSFFQNSSSTNIDQILCSYKENPETATFRFSIKFSWKKKKKWEQRFILKFLWNESTGKKSSFLPTTFGWQLLTGEFVNSITERNPIGHRQKLGFLFVEFQINSLFDNLHSRITIAKRKLYHILLYGEGHALDTAICSYKWHGSVRNL